MSDATRFVRKQNIIALVLGLGLVAFTTLVARQFLGRLALPFVVVVIASGLWAHVRGGGPVPRNLQPVSPTVHPELYRLVQILVHRGGLTRVPDIYFLPMRGYNAATLWTGPEPMLVITPALLNGLSPRELSAVLAHEVAHIKNGDFVIYTVARVLQSITVILSQAAWILLFFFFPFLLLSGAVISLGSMLILAAAPFVGIAIQMALLRAREFSADLGAAELTGDPEALASALRRIDQSSKSIWEQLFPVLRQSAGIFMSHPATEERIRRLRTLTPPGSGFAPRRVGWSRV